MVVEKTHIKPLTKYTAEVQNELGEFGYTTTSKYKVTKHESEENTTIHITLVDLKDELHKKYVNSDEDFERFSEMIPMGYSFGAINLETQNTNVNAIRFYRRSGFEIEGIDLSYYTNDDVEGGEVAIFMKRKL